MSSTDPSAPGSAPRRERVAVLCSANRCRSPLAAAMLRRQLAMRNVPVDVTSAGFQDSGLPATAPTIEVADGLALDLRAHTSRRVGRDLLVSADLVVGMERLHVREAVLVEPSVWPRAFTLREVVRRAEMSEPRAPGQPLRSWLEILSVGRDRMALMGSSPTDDVRDPTTDRTVDHGSTAAELDDLVRRLVSRAWPA